VSDAGKPIEGNKQHILGRYAGLLPHAIVHSLFGQFPFLAKTSSDRQRGIGSWPVPDQATSRPLSAA
jgi:hypothetical protein